MIGIRLKMIRQQRIGFLLLIGIILLAEAFIHRDTLFFNKVEKESIPIEIKEYLADVNSKSKNTFDTKSIISFNPNEYSKENWITIGFSEKQAEVIIRYKNRLGGSFSSKEQIKNCYVISEEKYKELEPFLLLPEKQIGNSGISSPPVNFTHNIHKKYLLQKFDPNQYTIEDWKKIGFSEKQAEIILKYKNRVGGKFMSKKQLGECFVISEEKYRELIPYIQLPETSYQADKLGSVKTERIAGKELNSASFTDVSSVIGNTSIAGRIIGFRKGLGGFVSKDQLNDVYEITPEMLTQLWASFTLDESKIRKINLQNVAEDELQKHIYLRKYKNKILKIRQEGGDPLTGISKNDPNYKFILLYIQK